MTTHNSYLQEQDSRIIHSVQRISVVNLGRTLQAKRCDDVLVNQRGSIKYRDAFYINTPQGEAWLFNYAVLVCWGVNESDRLQLINEIQDLIIDPVSAHATEQFSFFVDEEKTFNIYNDVLTLPNNEPLTRLAVSHALAQSSKLVAFEEQAESVIQKNSYISKELARSGTIPLSRKRLARLRGTLFDVSSDISLHFNLLDTPEFFWNYPDQEDFYLRAAKYMDLQPRIEILNKKLNTIHAMLDMLATEQHHKHSSFLEWIIIILIAIDILIYFLPN